MDGFEFIRDINTPSSCRSDGNAKAFIGRMNWIG